MLRYAIFGAIDPYYFKSFYGFGIKYLKLHLNDWRWRRYYYDIYIENYKLSQANFRINSYYLLFYEFYNLYLNGLDIKVNFYIRQLYGGTDLYECDPDGVNIKNLDKLTTPISNSKCKNRKSLINRLFNFNGEKIITGYITPDSYFDIYAEINKETNSIDINPLLTSQLKIDSTAKYLRKDVEYRMNFHANHLIKLEPGFDARITITNGQTTTSINPDKPTTEVSGNDFTIKSDNDAMVYFFGALPSYGVKQIQIENRKNHYVKISNAADNLIIDFGFGGYFPTTYPFDFKAKNNTIYLDNLYDRMKTKLVKDEYLYIYSFSENNPTPKVDYIQNGLNIKNNDFNIFYIPKNDDYESGENAIIINAYKYKIIHNIKFCKKNTEIDLLINGEYEEKRKIYQEETLIFNLNKGSNKISFTTNQPFIYSYSTYDVFDTEIIEKNIDWKNQRVIYSDLSITEVKDEGSNNNKISITFKPNYKKSSTRYIIIVALKNDINTLENFKDPCFVVKLLNERPGGIKVFKVYDIGDEEEINAIVDISSITELNQDQHFLVNIISQELRFDKKINFYNPKEFEHIGKRKSKDDEDPYDNTPSSSDEIKEEGDSEGSSLVLAIVLPIIGVIIIVAIALFYINRKRNSSLRSREQIEKFV